MLIYVVEDNDWYRRLIEYTLSLNPDHQVKAFATPEAMLKEFSKVVPDVVTLDYFLPGMNGAELLVHIKERAPLVEVIIISEQDNIQTAVDLLQQGAYDYIVKSTEIKDRLLNTLQHIGRHKKLEAQVQTLKQEVRSKYRINDLLIGESDAIQRIMPLVETACRTTISVVVTGETGTGKEMVAKAIHYNSDRRDQPFVPVNMAAIPHELIESELFGHEKGAFTGANFRRIGKFEEAQHGTLFLDEIGEMDLGMQAKLLRVLQDKVVVRIGSNKPIQLDCRIIVATHRDLTKEVKAKRFREDLYYRLYGLTIELPPLRERGNDILLLARHFIKIFCEENGFSIPEISSGAMKKLIGHSYPGNIRELKSVVELSVALSNGQVIREEHLNFGRNDELFNPEEGLTLKEYTDRIILHYLDRNDGDVKLTASQLDISYSTIYRMLKEREQA